MSTWFTVDRSCLIQFIWQNCCYNLRFNLDISDEIGLDLKIKPENFNESYTYTVGFKWNSTNYDRMSNAINRMVYKGVSSQNYLIWRLLGQETEDVVLKCNLPKRYSAPNLPELNHSQVYAVRTVLQRQISLIQGPPGTGKTVTSASIVYHLSQGHNEKVLVCAPSNTAVDQLCEKISRTGLKVVRVCARAREAVASPVNHLTLHVQSQNVPGYEELRRLQQLKDETGELSRSDEVRYKQLKKAVERKSILCLSLMMICSRAKTSIDV